jgi:type III pantothenate kinase
MKADLLLVDVGNTRVKWATARARGPIRVVGDAATVAMSAAWVGALARKWPGHHLVLASVVPRWNPVFNRAFRGRVTVVSGGLPATSRGFVVASCSRAMPRARTRTTQARLSLPGHPNRARREPRGVYLQRLRLRFAYPKPAELGADRIAAAVAAHAAGCFPSIIVACGTATAFTVLDAKGRLCGGAIAPGLQAQLDALIGATAQLPAASLKMPRSPLAKSTRDAIRAGVLLNFQGGVKEIVRGLTDALPRGTKPRIVLTGGNAKLAARSLSGDYKVRPLLVLEGLRIIGNRVWNPERE